MKAMNPRSVKELMKKNIFVNKDNTVECVNAYIEMCAYYMYALRTRAFDTVKCLGQIDILKAMARKEGYNWAEIFVEANKLVRNAEVIAEQTGLAEAC